MLYKNKQDMMQNHRHSLTHQQSCTLNIPGNAVGMGVDSGGLVYNTNYGKLFCKHLPTQRPFLLHGNGVFLGALDDLLKDLFEGL